MAAVYEEVALSAMSFDAVELVYTYDCPCGDVFEIGLEELHDGEDIAHCGGCLVPRTLKIKVLYDKASLPPLP